MGVERKTTMRRMVKCASALLLCLCIILIGAGVPFSAEKTVDLTVKGCWS